MNSGERAAASCDTAERHRLLERTLIVIPAYNEEGSLKSTMDELL